MRVKRVVEFYGKSTAIANEPKNDPHSETEHPCSFHTQLRPVQHRSVQEQDPQRCCPLGRLRSEYEDRIRQLRSEAPHEESVSRLFSEDLGDLAL